MKTMINDKSYGKKCTPFNTTQKYSTNRQFHAPKKYAAVKKNEIYE